jgi:predicted SprT family Zn-dependent metalloprotease
VGIFSQILRVHSTAFSPQLAQRRIEAALARIPALQGGRIRIRFVSRLSAHRGELLSGKPVGRPVHAGTFLRKREIALEPELLDSPHEFARIFFHELFHFVWLRLGNPARRSWEALLETELRRRARGELGWSAELRKESLLPTDRPRRSRRWREYACESFCDSAAFLLCGSRRHQEFTLAPAFRRRRRSWFRRLLARPAISI